MFVRVIELTNEVERSLKKELSLINDQFEDTPKVRVSIGSSENRVYSDEEVPIFELIANC